MFAVTYVGEKGQKNFVNKSQTRLLGEVQEEEKSCQVPFVIIIFYMAFRMFRLFFSSPPASFFYRLQLNSEIGSNSNFFTSSDVKKKIKEKENRSR